MKRFAFLAGEMALAEPPAVARRPMPLSHEIGIRYLGIYLAEKLLKTLTFGGNQPTDDLFYQTPGGARPAGSQARPNGVAPEAVAHSGPSSSHTRDILSHD